MQNRVRWPVSAKRVLILWDDGDLEHATRHGVTWQEIEDVLRSPRRITEPAKRGREKRVATNWPDAGG